MSQTAIVLLAQTNLRNVIGDFSLDTCLTSRDVITAKLRATIDHATGRWGSRETRGELKRIDPPVDVADVRRQMKAERDRRALILEAEGGRNIRGSPCRR